MAITTPVYESGERGNKGERERGSEKTAIRDQRGRLRLQRGIFCLTGGLGETYISKPDRVIGSQKIQQLKRGERS